MDIHYNAFISYRHHPDDIRAATQIHRALERFRVPKTLRKIAKLPLKLFRDKDELPITSNLSDDIFSALQNSDFLIVICSVHTKESLWVQREIETFLQTHSRHQVLTVLVSGEPYDVIPEILLYEDIVDPATGETRRIPMEPLSCDWRIGHRKALREELPRLAAALLHCGYDELRQRQRQYRMKQLITAFSIALTFSLGLAAYFLYTSITIRNANIQIQENLDQALRNQSRHLSTAAQELLDEGDRLTAMALLLEALPSEDSPRPYVADAEYVLTKALGVYSEDYTMAAQGALIPNSTATVYDFALTEDRDTIYLMDSRYAVSVWDTHTLQQTALIVPPCNTAEILDTTTDSDLLITVSQNMLNTLQCYSKQGALLWEQDKLIAAALSEDTKTVYTIVKDGGNLRYLCVLDAKTGEDLHTPLLLPDTPSEEKASGFCQKRIREDTLIPVAYWDWEEHIFLLDPKTAQTIDLFLTENPPRCCTTTENGKVIFMVSDGSGYYNGLVGNSHTSSPARSDIFCYDIRTGELLWESEITTNLYTSEHIIQEIPDTELLLCQSGNTLQLIRSQDGSPVQSCDAVVGITKIVSIDADHVLGILEDGSIFSYSFSKNECIAFDYNMEGNLKKAAMGRGTFTLPFFSSQVTLYNFLDTPYAWEYETGSYPYSSDIRRSGNALILRFDDRYCLFDLPSQQIRWEIPWDFPTLLDFSSDGSRLWILENYAEAVSVDAKTGSKTQYSLPTSIDGSSVMLLNDPQLFEDEIWYLLSYSRYLMLCRYSPETGEATLYDVVVGQDDIPKSISHFADNAYILESLQADPSSMGLTDTEIRWVEELLQTLPEFTQIIESAQLLTCRNGFAWVYTGNGSLYEVNLPENTSTLRSSGLSSVPAYAFRETDGAMAITQEQEILVFLPGGEEVLRIPLAEERPGALHFYQDALLVLTDKGSLLRFGSDGKQLSRTELSISDTYATDLFDEQEPLDIDWKFTEDNRLILSLFSVANIIDCNTWSACGYLTQFILYDEDTDQFVVRGDTAIRAFPRYTTQELIDLAHETLGSYTLSQEQKEAYGIE